MGNISVDEYVVEELEDSFTSLKNCIEQMKKEFPNFVTAYKRLSKEFDININEITTHIKTLNNSRKIEDLEGELEDLTEELEETNGELLNYIHYKQFKPEGVYDELKIKVLINAFHQYNLDELENRLNTSYI